MKVNIIQARISKETEKSTSKRDKDIEELHFKLIEYYEAYTDSNPPTDIKNVFGNCKSEKDFANVFTKLFAGKLVGVETILKWISQINKGIVYSGHKKIVQPKTSRSRVTRETILCLITLLLDFPFWTSCTMAQYINSENGPNNKNKISSRTVRYYIKSLQFTQKRRAMLSNPARNSLGLTAARVVWARIALEIAESKRTTLCFVDECTVCYNDFGSGYYGFIGINPEVVTTMHKFSFNMIAMVVPGFGVIYQLTTETTTHQVYVNFLKEAFKVVRTLICDENQRLVLIHDNAKYHRHDSVVECLKNLAINELPIIPYSPQLNEVAECLFGFCKQKSKLEKISNPPFKRKLQKVAMRNWEDVIVQYDARRSAIYYGVWKVILKRCIKGKPLTSDHIHHVPNCLAELRDIKTNRII